MPCSLSLRLLPTFRRKTVLSQRDVPGMSQAAIPLLASFGGRAVSVGVNGGSTPPYVPRAFMWKDPDSGAAMPAMWHPLGCECAANLVYDGGRVKHAAAACFVLYCFAPAINALRTTVGARYSSLQTAALGSMTPSSSRASLTPWCLTGAGTTRARPTTRRR